MMKNIYLEKAMKTKKIIIGVLIFIFISSPVLASNEDRYQELKDKISPLMKDLEENVSSKALSNCLEVLGPLYDMATMEFLQFLDTHYSNNSSTSSLNQTAVMKFIDYRRYITDTTLSVNPQAKVGGETAKMIRELQSFLVCEGLGSAYIEVAKMKMYEYARTNSSVKKASIATEAMAPINEEMRELGFSFAKMYGYFSTFRDKLPGFLSDCL
jgi:hypothetical protein